MKLCKDCNHLQFQDGQLVCHHPLAHTRTDLVTGLKSYKTASAMRYQDCGEEAALFTPQVGLIRSFLNLFSNP